MKWMKVSRMIVVGPASPEPSSVDSPFKYQEYLQADFRYHYIFHIDYSNIDQRWNVPGIAQKRDIFVTADMFPLVTTWHQISVGPLLARSPADYIFVTTIKGDPQRGAVTRVGLIRVSRLSVITEFNGETMNSPIFGDIDDGDMSLWTRWHRPPVEQHVRIVFPVAYPFPPAMMYDFKALRSAACMPGLAAHLLGPTAPLSIFPDSRNQPSGTPRVQPLNDADRPQILDAIPETANENPFVDSPASSRGASSIVTMSPDDQLTPQIPSVSATERLPFTRELMTPSTSVTTNRPLVQLTASSGFENARVGGSLSGVLHGEMMGRAAWHC